MIYLKFKRFYDFILSFLCLIILSPVFLIIIFAIRVETKGNILFKQKRVGKNKKTFYILKFRTMRAETPHEIPTHLLENPEQWITKVGKFLRKTSLDELPQLVNILKGEMSFVGPRPALWNQYDLIEERDKYKANSILPGITGWAQVNGRDALHIAQKAKMDGEYVKNISLFTDIKLIFKTFLIVLTGRDVIEGSSTGESNEIVVQEKKRACIVSITEITRMSLISIYTDYFRDKNISYDIICVKKTNDNEYEGAAEIYEFLSPKLNSKNKIGKVMHILRMRKFVKQITSKNNYDILIVWNQLTALFFRKTLLKKYRNKYIINVRDYHYDNFPIIRFFQRKLYKNSLLNTISSPGFIKYLPKEKFLLLHSMNFNLLKNITRKQKSNHINILNIGQIGWPDKIIELIDKIKNDNRYSFYVIGEGSNVVQTYIEKNGINNVYVKGRFDISETAKYLRNADVIFNLYGYDNIHVKSAISIKFNYAVFLQLPILTYENTIVNKLGREIGISYEVNKKIPNDFAEQFYQWYLQIDDVIIEKQCSEFILQIRESHKQLYNVLNRFFIDQNEGIVNNK